MDRGLHDINSNGARNNTSLVYIEIIRRLIETQNFSNANTNLDLSGITAQPSGILTPQHLPWQPGGPNGGSGGNGGSTLLGAVALLGQYGLQQQQQRRADNASSTEEAATIAAANAGRLLAFFLGPLLLQGKSHETNLPQFSGFGSSGLPVTSAYLSVQHGATSQGEPSTFQRLQTEGEQNYSYFPPQPTASFAPHGSNQSADARRGEPQHSSSATQLPPATNLITGMVRSLDELTPFYGLGTDVTLADMRDAVSHRPSTSTANPDLAFACAPAAFPTETKDETEEFGYSTNKRPNRIQRKCRRSESSTQNSEDNTGSGDLLKRQCGSKKRHIERRAYNAVSFAQKLFKMIADQEASGVRNVVEFLDGGGGFWLHDPGAISALMPKYGFRGTKFSGFRRQLTSYGFWVERQGSEKGAFKHPFFSRGRPDLCSKIVRDSQEYSDDDEAENLVDLRQINIPQATQASTPQNHVYCSSNVQAASSLPENFLCHQVPRVAACLENGSTEVSRSDQTERLRNKGAHCSISIHKRGHRQRSHDLAVLNRRVYNAESFVQKLFKMITDQESAGKRDVVEFLDGGGGFWLHDPSAIPELMPHYNFRGTKFSGFRRQLTSYGFIRQMAGPDAGAYKNPLFSRGRPDLCDKIRRDGPSIAGYEST